MNIKLIEYFVRLKAIILVGLPGVGKTNWAIEYSKKNPNKAYYILGVSTILDKMKVFILNN